MLGGESLYFVIGATSSGINAEIAAGSARTA
jgi:hypothetical protein